MKKFFKVNSNVCAVINCGVTVPADKHMCNTHTKIQEMTTLFYKQKLEEIYPKPINPINQTLKPGIISLYSKNTDDEKRKQITADANNKLSSEISAEVIYNEILIRMTGHSTDKYESTMEYYRSGKFSVGIEPPTEVEYYTPDFTAMGLEKKTLVITKKPDVPMDVKRKIIQTLYKMLTAYTCYNTMYKLFIYIINGIQNNESHTQIAGIKNAGCKRFNLKSQMGNNMFFDIEDRTDDEVQNIATAMALTQIELNIIIDQDALNRALVITQQFVTGKQSVVNAALSEILQSLQSLQPLQIISPAEKIQELIEFLHNFMKTCTSVKLTPGVFSFDNKIRGMHVSHPQDKVTVYNDQDSCIASILLSNMKKVVTYNADIICLDESKTDVISGLKHQYIVSCDKNVYQEYTYPESMDMLSRLVII